MLEAINLSIHTRGRLLLRQVSLRVEPGEVLAVVGPNGAGKSTLVRALCGEVAPTTGDVRMHGRPLRAWSHAQAARCRAEPRV